MSKGTSVIRCACGEVEAEVVGAPIACVACYCGDCQEAGKRLDALPGARPARDTDGGTSLVLVRNDRFRVARGAERLDAHKLRERSPTSRYVAACCNTPMYLGFDRGPHWVSIFRRRFGEEAPPLEMRLSTKTMPGYEAPRDGVPSYGSFPLRLPGRLMAARVAMLFGR